MYIFSNLLREKFKWSITTFLAVLSALHLIESQLGFEISLNLALLNFLFAFLLTCLAFLFVQLGEWRFRRFIKLSKKDSVTIVVSGYQNKRKYDPLMPRAHNLRYFKIKNGEQYDLVGAHGYLMGLDTAKVLAKFVYELREFIACEIDVIADDNPISKNGPIICFGSPNSNLQSEKLLPEELCKFCGSDQMFCHKLHDTPYTASTVEDFGVLARLPYNNSAEDSTWAFICAGIDEEGTVAASHYFLDNWRRLGKQNTAFLHLLRCRKEAPQKPEKIAGFRLSKDGVWEAE